jgi:hypothetical protein
MIGQNLAVSQAFQSLETISHHAKVETGDVL